MSMIKIKFILWFNEIELSWKGVKYWERIKLSYEINTALKFLNLFSNLAMLFETQNNGINYNVIDTVITFLNLFSNIVLLLILARYGLFANLRNPIRIRWPVITLVIWIGFWVSLSLLLDSSRSIIDVLLWESPRWIPLVPCWWLSITIILHHDFEQEESGVSRGEKAIASW